MRDYKKMSDQKLLAATLEGDEAAFAEFTGRHRNPIINYIYRMLDDDDRSLDLAEVTFARVWMNVEEYRGQVQDGFSTIIYKIAHHLAIQELRRRKRREN